MNAQKTPPITTTLTPPLAALAEAIANRVAVLLDQRLDQLARGHAGRPAGRPKEGQAAFSQRTVATWFGVTQRTVAAWEQGTRMGPLGYSRDLRIAGNWEILNELASHYRKANATTDALNTRRTRQAFAEEAAFRHVANAARSRFIQTADEGLAPR